MRMSKNLCLLLLALVMSVSAFANAGTATSVEFYVGNINDAKAKAEQEGKLFLVDFHAKWCAPCKWMDETTFTDRDIAKMLNENYVSLKVDIDEFEGFDLKQQYKIKYLPTILIFNAKGELIDRLEETMSPRKLIAVLENHHNNNDAVPTVKPVNTSPSAKPAEVIVDKKEPIMQEDDFEMPKHGKYRIQVGMYADFKNTFKYVNELKQEFAEPIIVLNDYQDGKIVYRIMMGEFESKNEAKTFIEILKNEFGISGIVK